MSKSNKNNLSSVILPIIRQIKAKTLAEEIIGVQPMAAPVASGWTLKYRYADERTMLKDAIKEIEKERADERARRKKHL